MTAVTPPPAGTLFGVNELTNRLNQLQSMNFSAMLQAVSTNQLLYSIWWYARVHRRATICTRLSYSHRNIASVLMFLPKASSPTLWHMGSYYTVILSELQSIAAFVLYQIILFGDADNLCEQIAQSRYLVMRWLKVKTATSWSHGVLSITPLRHITHATSDWTCCHV